MKKLLLGAIVVGLAVGAYAQGQINLGNISNSGTGPTATTGGLFWIQDVNSLPFLINQDFNVSFFGGSDANSLVLLKSFAHSGGGAAGGPGTFLDLSGVPVTIPGATTVGYFQIAASFGLLSEFAGTTAVFSNPLGNPLASPPGTPTDFTGMPALIMVYIPEPSTFALAGLGAAALLIFRRRN